MYSFTVEHVGVWIGSYVCAFMFYSAVLLTFGATSAETEKNTMAIVLASSMNCVCVYLSIINVYFRVPADHL